MTNLWNLDLRFAKIFTLGQDRSVTISAEVFNVFNSNKELQLNRSANSSVFGRVDEILSPRIWRFGARLNF